MAGITNKKLVFSWVLIFGICSLCIAAGAYASSLLPLNVPLKNIPAALIQKGNDFIISKVSEKYFHDHYKINESSGCAEYQNKIQYCYLHYSHSVFDKLGFNQEIIIEVSPEKPITGNPVLISESNEPTVSKDRAIEAAKAKLKDYQIKHPKEYNLTSLPVIKAILSIYKNDEPTGRYTWQIVFGQQCNYDPNIKCCEGYPVYVNAYTNEASDVIKECSTLFMPPPPPPPIPNQ